jgi:hypothetical protein
VSNSFDYFWSKEKPTARSLLAVGSVNLLMSALLHPIPSSRRHVIRVDIPVPVDVIRVDFWMRIIMKMANADFESLIAYPGSRKKEKFKIPIAAIDFLELTARASLSCPPSLAG